MPSRPPSPMPVGGTTPETSPRVVFFPFAADPDDLGGVALRDQGVAAGQEDQSPGHVEVVGDRAGHLGLRGARRCRGGRGRGERGRGRGRGRRGWWRWGRRGRPTGSDRWSGPDRPRCSRSPRPRRGRRRRTGTVVSSPPTPLSPAMLCVGRACAWAGQHPGGPERQNRAVPTDETTTQPSPVRWRILGVTLAVGFMALLDVTIVNVAIPSMQAGLGTTTATIQWVVSGYALAFGLTLVAGGRLGDVYGRRALMMIGLTGFIVGSAASGLAADAELVIAARVLQGMSAGLLTPQSSGLIQQLFSGKERGIAFGYFGTTVGVASAIGPILGGAADRRCSGRRTAGATSSASTCRSGWWRCSSSGAGCRAAAPTPGAPRRNGTSTWSARCCWGRRCSACCCRWWSRRTGRGRGCSCCWRCRCSSPSSCGGSGGSRRPGWRRCSI